MCILSAIDTLIAHGNGLSSRTFFEMQKKLNPDYVIEVGAHAAEFSLSMSEEFKVPGVAFEASPEIYEKFKNNFRHSSINYLNYAISDIDGEEVFMVHQNPLDGNNSILQRNGTVSILISHKVKSYRLDSYLENVSFNSACLWVDVEGANQKVLLGAEKTLDRVSSVFIETEDYAYWEDQWLTMDVVKFLNSHDFILVDSEKIYSEQQNLIFIKKER